MTIYQKLKAQLESYGMFPEHATAVMELVKQAPANESMVGRWDDTAEGYPPVDSGLVGYNQTHGPRLAGREFAAGVVPTNV